MNEQFSETWCERVRRNRLRANPFRRGSSTGVRQALRRISTPCNHCQKERSRMARLRMTSSAVAVGAAAALCVAAAVATPAVAATKAHVRPSTLSYFEIVNSYGNLCLDAQTDATHNPGQNGDPVQLYKCAGGLNQSWIINANGTITNADGGKCLDAMDDATHSPGENGDRIQLWGCNGGGQQQWQQDGNGLIADEFGLV